MLTCICNTYGGLVNKNTNKNFVQWVINDRNLFINTIIPILEKYPPLTTRMRLQYLFFKKYLFANTQGPSTIEQYLIERTVKYKDRELITPLFTGGEVPHYFKE